MFLVIPSKFDFGVIDGILGNYNENAQDDFILDGVSYAKNLTAYFDLFK